MRGGRHGQHPSPNPSLDHLRDGARALQRGVRTADPAALATVRQHHPRCDIALARKQFALHDAQLTMARRYGFTGWPALVRYVELAKDLGTDPGAVDERGLDSADRFCALASLRYDADDEPRVGRPRPISSPPIRHSCMGMSGRPRPPPIPPHSPGTCKRNLTWQRTAVAPTDGFR